MTDDEIERRFAEGSGHFAEIHEQLTEVLSLLAPIPQMQADIETAKKDAETVKDLVEAWNAVKTGGKFVKWVAPLIGGIIGAWAAVKAAIWGFMR